MSGIKSLIVSAGLVLVAFLFCTSSSSEHAWLNISLGAVRTFHAIGGLLSLISAVELFLRVIRKEPVLSLVPWLILFLVGVLMVSMQGSVALGLAGIAIAIIVRDVMQSRSTPSEE